METYGDFDSVRDPDIREITFRNALFSLSKVRYNIGLLKVGVTIFNSI